MHAFRMSIVVGLCFAFQPLMAQTTADPHLSDVASPLYARSAFAHGYMHGYEEGFHLADSDIQMGHLLPGVHMRHEDRELNPRYRASFGDRNLFMLGYKLGTRSGYSDSIGGHSFRALTLLRQASAGLTPAPQTALFDRAFYEGYISGERSGATEPSRRTDFSAVSRGCTQSRADTKQSDGEQYCDAYTRGFQVGYADGIAERPENGRSIQTADIRK